MSSIMRRRRGLISVIGGSPVQGWGESTQILADQRQTTQKNRCPRRNYRVSGLVQSAFTIHRPTGTRTD